MSQRMRLLIHWPGNMLDATGGPSGYLNNLKYGLDVIGFEDYSFLDPITLHNDPLLRLKSFIPHRIVQKRWLRNDLAILDSDENDSACYSDYNLIHFHSTRDMYAHRSGLQRYRGKILLTSHTPCIYHKELTDGLNPKDLIRYKDALAQLEKIDEYAFTRADYVFFPCAESEEPYFRTWSKYPTVRDQDKIRYLPTGIRQCKSKESREAIRRRYGIPGNAFVVTYVGRHNEIKGYGDLVEMAPRELKNDTWFLIAGKEGPLSKCKHEHWIEIGWTSDPHSIIAAADLFVLPNRETYFDLVLLESMSLGQIILTTRTGGNKFFEKLPSCGILFYDDADSFSACVDTVRRMTFSDRLKLGDENTRLFNRCFTCELFAQRYIEILEEIVEE